MTSVPVAYTGLRRASLRRGAIRTAIVSPGVMLLLLLALLPLLALLYKGFSSSDHALTLANFTKVFGSNTYTGLVWRTLRTAFAVTAFSIALGWPAGWALAKHTAPRVRSLTLGLVMIPYVSSQLLLIYGFITLVQAGGPLMAVLHSVGLASAQSSIMYTPTATLAMLVYESVPTAVLLLFSAADQVDDALLEAARSLGASKMRRFTTIVWPLSGAILTANFAITFVQTVGAFAEPALLGGTHGQMVGNAIATELDSVAGQQFAVALSLILLVASLAVVGIMSAAIAATGRSADWRALVWSRRRTSAAPMTPEEEPTP